MIGTIEFKGKTTITVEKKNGELIIEVDGKDHDLIESIFRSHLSDGMAIAGTYFPPSNSLLNAMNVLKVHVFQKVDNVEGDVEQIPREIGDDEYIY